MRLSSTLIKRSKPCGKLRKRKAFFGRAVEAPHQAAGGAPVGDDLGELLYLVLTPTAVHEEGGHLMNGFRTDTKACCGGGCFVFIEDSNH